MTTHQGAQMSSNDSSSRLLWPWFAGLLALCLIGTVIGLVPLPVSYVIVLVLAASVILDARHKRSHRAD